MMRRSSNLVTICPIIYSFQFKENKPTRFVFSYNLETISLRKKVSSITHFIHTCKSGLVNLTSIHALLYSLIMDHSDQVRH